MKKIFGILTAILLLLSLVGCEKELEIKYKEIDPIPVIEGTLSQSGAYVRLTMTTPMGEPMNLTPLKDATVLITDLTDNTSEQLTLNNDGNYIGTMVGISGHRYELNVSRNGESYSMQCLMPEPTELIALTFNWIHMPYDDVAVLKVSFTDSSATAGEYFWVRVYRNGEAYKWNLASDRQVTAGIINDIFMTSRKDLDEEDEADALREGDIVSVKVTPISREMYDYLEAVSSDSNGPRLFSGDFCLGFFLAAPIAEGSVEFHPDLIPEY